MDIIRHIYSFGSPDHRRQLKKVHANLRSVLLTTVVDRYPVEDKHTLMGLREFYRNRRCHCCSRHTHRKPIIHLTHILVIQETPHNVPECKDHDDCLCDCRHNARLFVRWLRVNTPLTVLTHREP